MTDIKPKPKPKHIKVEYESESKSESELELSLEFITELCNAFDQSVIALNKSQHIVPALDIHILYNNECKKLIKKHNVSGFPKKSLVNHCYVEYVNRDQLEPNGLFDTITTNLGSRGGSGILEVTTGLSGLKNSCKYDCHFCPNERIEFGGKHDISRSYLSNEGVFKAGLREDFDPYRLMIHRLIELETLGHVIDKIEWIIIGGTFHSYPEEYLDNYMSEGWRALNTFHYFSRRFQGPYAGLIHTWIQNGGLRGSLRDIPVWDEVISELGKAYPVAPISGYQHDNESVKCARCVGLSIETRPDQISMKSIAKMREYGCTRIQLGIQHLSKKVLQINSRDHGKSELAIKRCVNNGFKVDLHLMIDLPGSTPESDMEYLTTVFQGNSHQADYCKLYYCLNLPFTMIRKWHNNAQNSYISEVEKSTIHEMMTSDNYTYRELMQYCNNKVENLVWYPYSESDPETFRKVSDQAMMMIPPWTRCVRVQRDFSEDRVSKASEQLVETTTDNKTLGFVSSTIRTNENQFILQRLKKKELHPYEIRSREIKNTLISDIYDGRLKLVTTRYANADGDEYYISLEYQKKEICEQHCEWRDIYDSYTIGHVRLRIPNTRTRTGMLPDVKGGKYSRPALIRELHVYGRLKGVTDVKAQQHSGGQGQGFGKLLMHAAEYQAILCQCNYVSVISGVGVRGYYHKLGYQLSDVNHYMVKDLDECIAPPKGIQLSSKTKTMIQQSDPAGSDTEYRTVTFKPTPASHIFLPMFLLFAALAYFIMKFIVH